MHILVQQSRLSDGSRRVTAITEITGINAEGDIEIVPIFRFVRTGTDPAGKVVGEFQATGFLPTFSNRKISCMVITSPSMPVISEMLVTLRVPSLMRVC